MRASLIMLVLCTTAACGARMERDGDAGHDVSAWLERIEHAHSVADHDDPASAEAALREALALPVPTDVAQLHERVVHQDLLFRIARADLVRGHAEHALIAAERGLALGGPHDLFRANLALVRGEALEALHRDSEAAASYYDALEINRRLLQHVLGAEDAGRP